MKVSVIIPSLNEAERIAPTVDAAFAAGAAEVILSDGGSCDATSEIARGRGARIVTGERVRGRQLNLGAEAASEEILLFLHADTLLPQGATARVVEAIDAGFVFGGFLIAFIENAARLRVVAAMINLRTRITRAPWGDQAQFVSRQTFLDAGGYPDLPIMEDYELARRMNRLGPARILEPAVRTSGRRFLDRGVIRTSALNWAIIASYHAGVSPQRLTRWYRAP